MTSTSEFTSGERVLCYEPDPTKVRVVYDAKILKVEKGEKKGEEVYLVHFQGWNDKWDRLVPREFLLKVTEESRSLQKQLFKEAEQFIKTKKKKRCQGQEAKEEEEGGKKKTKEKDEVKVREERKEEKLPKKQRKGEKPVVEETSVALIEEEEEAFDPDDPCPPIPIPIPEAVKSLLSLDRQRIVVESRLHHLPSSPNCVRFLESFVRAFGHERLAQHERAFCRGGTG